MFIDFVVYGKLAEVFGTYTTKGSAILIEGRLTLNQWEYEGQKRSKHEVIVESLQLLGKKATDEDNSNSDFYNNSESNKQSYKQEITDEDIPF